MNDLSPYTITRTHPAGAPLFHNGSGHLGEELNLKEYWRIVRKHRALISAVIFATAVCIVAWRLTSVPLYKAASEILIQPSAPQVMAEVKDVSSDQTGGAGQDFDYYKTQFDLMKSDSLAAQVIHDFDLESSSLFIAPQKPKGILSQAVSNLHAWFGNFLGSKLSASAGDEDTSETHGVKPELIQAYLGHLTIEPVKGTRLVKVEFTTSDPALSAWIANAHVQTYIRQGLDLHAQTGKNVEDFLRQKLGELREQVEKSEAALNVYRRDRGIISLGDTGAEASRGADPLGQRMSELNSDLLSASEKRIVLETQHQLIARGDYESLPEVLSNGVIQHLKEQVVLLSTQYASMSNRFNPGYHPLDDLKVRLDASRRSLNEQVRDVDESVEADYRAAVANEAKVAKELSDVKNQALRRNDTSLQEAVLERDVESNRELYKAVMQRINEIRVSADVPTSNVSVVDEATPPKQRTGPSLLKLLVFGCAAAGFCGIGLAFFLESLDDTLKTPEEVMRWLELPSIGVVPYFQRANGGGYASRYIPYHSNRDSAKGALEAHGATQYKDIVVSHGNFSTVAEAYRTIRTGVMFSKAGGAPRTILITSATAGEGKTVTSVNMAAAFAHTGSRTLIIDTDLRRARCHEIFELDSEQGLSEVLVGQREFQDLVFTTKVPHLWVLGAGSPPPNPSELLASPEMRKLIQVLAQNYDYVILDSAPVMPVSDTVAISSMVEGVLVVADSATSRRVVRDACSRLSQVGARILGVILNRIEVGAKSHYHDQYSYYHSYKPREGRGPKGGADTSTDGDEPLV